MVCLLLQSLIYYQAELTVKHTRSLLYTIHACSRTHSCAVLYGREHECTFSIVTDSVQSNYILHFLVVAPGAPQGPNDRSLFMLE